MDPSQLLTPGIAEQYRERFGDEGAFDTAMFSPMVTLSLMAEALRRDRAVERDDLEAMHQMLYRQPLPESGVPTEPSGHGVVVPQPEGTLPAAWTEVPPETPPAPPEEAAPAEATAEAPERQAQYSTRR